MQTFQTLDRGYTHMVLSIIQKILLIQITPLYILKVWGVSSHMPNESWSTCMEEVKLSSRLISTNFCGDISTETSTHFQLSFHVWPNSIQSRLASKLTLFLFVCAMWANFIPSSSPWPSSESSAPSSGPVSNGPYQAHHTKRPFSGPPET